MHKSKKHHRGSWAITASCLIVVSFFCRSVEAESNVPHYGIDPVSHIAYVELNRPDWLYAEIDIRPDSREFIVSNDSGVGEIYDLDFQLVGSLRGHTDDILSLAWSPNENVIATGSADKTVRVWDVAALSTFYNLHHSGEVIELAWSPDGTKLATVESVIVGNNSEGHLFTDDILRIWDLNGKELSRFNFHNSGTSLDWNPDGSFIAGSGSVTSLGSSVLIWDAETLAVVKTFPSAWSAILPSIGVLTAVKLLMV